MDDKTFTYYYYGKVINTLYNNKYPAELLMDDLTYIYLTCLLFIIN